MSDPESKLTQVQLLELLAKAREHDDEISIELSWAADLNEPDTANSQDDK